MEKRKGLEYFVDYLSYNGFKVFFLVTGGAIAPTVDYLGKKEEIKYYCFQHEQSAAMAAEAYYRTTGKIGVVLTTSGPGSQNLLNGLCGCWYESVPCLFVSGQVSTYEQTDFIDANPRQLGFQETNIVEAFRPFTKYAYKVTNVEELPGVLNKAILESTTGRFGPSFIDLPVDVQTSRLDNVELTTFNSLKKINKQSLEQIIHKLNKKVKESKRPLLLIGNGVRLAGAKNQINKLVNKLGIPFVVSWGGFDLIPHNHPKFLGDIGVYGDRGANFAIQNCDLLISIGSRMDTRQTGGNLKYFSRDSYKVMVDLDPNEIYKGRGLEIDMPIVEDAKYFIEEWLNNYEFKSLDNEWEKATKKWKNLKIDDMFNKGSEKDVLSVYEFLKHLNLKMPHDAVIIPDQGGNLVSSMQSLEVLDGQRVFSNFGNSSMGYSLPASIGASVGTNAPVISINGDGGFQMNIQELQTIKHYNLPVKIFILNNQCYGIIKQFQDAYFGSRYTASDQNDYSAPDFCEIAKAYGIETVRATKDNYKEVTEYALATSAPILVDVVIDKEQKLRPKLEFGNPLEDMSPYMSQSDIKENMLIELVPRNEKAGEWVNLADEMEK